jgi:hypothetical protein
MMVPEPYLIGTKIHTERRHAAKKKRGQKASQEAGLLGFALIGSEGPEPFYIQSQVRCQLRYPAATAYSNANRPELQDRGGDYELRIMNDER